MRLVLDNVKDKYYQLLLEMADALKFKVTKIDSDEEDIDNALGRAIAAGKKEGRLNEQEQAEFESWLSSNSE